MKHNKTQLFELLGQLSNNGASNFLIEKTQRSIILTFQQMSAGRRYRLIQDARGQISLSAVKAAEVRARMDKVAPIYERWLKQWIRGFCQK